MLLTIIEEHADEGADGPILPRQGEAMHGVAQGQVERMSEVEKEVRGLVLPLSVCYLVPARRSRQTAQTARAPGGKQHGHLARLQVIASRRLGGA
jgi:hypothetical protein